MTPREPQEVLIEATLSAHRERDRDGLPMAPPEWWDLAPDGREEVARLQLEARFVESLIDERGWSATVKAVLGRIG